MNAKILSWNVKGLNERDKRLQVRNLLKFWGANVVCLQETKLYLITRAIVRSLWCIHHIDWLYLGSIGASGGILIMWDTQVVAKIDDAIGYYSVFCKFQNVLDEWEWAFSGVYGPQYDMERLLMWEELAGVAGWWGVLLGV